MCATETVLLILQKKIVWSVNFCINALQRREVYPILAKAEVSEKFLIFVDVGAKIKRLYNHEVRLKKL